MELDLFAACLPGLEVLLAEEVRGLGAAPREVAGGVACRGPVELLLQAHLRLGTASHLLLRCGEFRCRHLAELTSKAAQLPWRAWLRPDRPFSVRATSKRSRLFHTGAVVERVTKGIAAALGATAPPGPAPLDAVEIAVRVVDDLVTLSLDTASTPLHRRGYRLEGAKAPLREDLAHALLRAAHFAPGQALLDPFCGAGTIAIEAATMALGLPPGRLRPPPLLGTALADEARWHALVAAATATAAGAAAEIAGSDRDAGAIAAAQANAARAGVAAAIQWTCAAVTAAPWLAAPATAPQPLLLATNPPFGHRVGKGRDLGPLYQVLGHRARQLGDVRVAILAHDPRLGRRTGLDLRVAFATRHGGMRIAAMVAGQSLQAQPSAAARTATGPPAP